jgi:hypothetical protein
MVAGQRPRPPKIAITVPSKTVATLMPQQFVIEDVRIPQ